MKFDEYMPFTMQILVDICSHAADTTPGQELRASATIRDVTILGSFSESRVSEHAQSSGLKEHAFSRVPSNAAQKVGNLSHFTETISASILARNVTWTKQPWTQRHTLRYASVTRKEYPTGLIACLQPYHHVNSAP